MKYKPNEEESEEIQELTDPYYFEKFCGSCIYFNTNKCPLKDKVLETTQVSDINCSNFFD